MDPPRQADPLAQCAARNPDLGIYASGQLHATVHLGVRLLGAVQAVCSRMGELVVQSRGALRAWLGVDVRDYRFRVATWNLNNRGSVAARSLGLLLASLEVDLLLAQELNKTAAPQVLDAAGLSWIRTAFDAGAPVPQGRPGRQRVTAIAGRGSPPTHVGVLDDLPLPERMIYGTVVTPAGVVTLASYHAPPGVGWGIIKVQHAHRLRDWVNATAGPLIVGADANTPEIDHPDRDLVRTRWFTGLRKLAGEPGDDVMFGGQPEHRLDDAFRCWLDQHPHDLARIRDDRPSGPLAVSHRTGKRHD
jgi:hypothetical protein